MGHARLGTYCPFRAEIVCSLQSEKQEIRVQDSRLFPLLKLLSYLVLLMMIIGAGYALIISIMNWPGIAV